MKITIESTDRITNYNGAPARVWRGHTEEGSEVAVLVTLFGENNPFAPPGEEAGLEDMPEPDASVIAAMFPEYAA